MKKTLGIILIAALMMAMSISTVFGVTSFMMELSADSTKVARGDEVVVTVKLKNFAAGETGINGLKATIDYDQSVFEVLEPTNFTPLGGWGAPTFNAANGQASMDHSIFIAEDHNMLSFTLTVKDSAAIGNTVVSVKDVEASDGNYEIYPSDQTITLTIQEGQTTTPPVDDNKDDDNSKDENTSTTYPTTGVEDFTIPAILTIAVIATIAYVRYNRIGK